MQVQHPAYSWMVIAPSIFIGLSVLVTDYALPPTSFSTRLQCLTTALLSAVLQHSALRGRIPPQTGLTRADVLMGVIYLYVGEACRASEASEAFEHPQGQPHGVKR